MCIRKKKYGSYIKPLLLLAISLLCSKAFSQVRAVDDTVINVPVGSFIQIKDSVSYFSSDTTIILPAGTDPYVVYERDKNQEFYDSLKVKVSKNNLAKKIYDFVIVTPAKTNKKEIDNESDANYVNFSGKKIRKIEIERLNVFGSSINNPALQNSSKIDKVLNKTHINTLEAIIRKNLLFKSGDSISPLVLSDNERILRQLSFIDDARIMIVPVSDYEADIVVITKDIYSIGANYDYRGFKRGSFSVFEKNIFGLGHEFEVEVPFNTDMTDSPGIGFNYSIDNIGKSFINLRTFFLDGLGKKSYGFSLDRSLVSSATKYAGGISVIQMFTSEDLDTMVVAEPLKYNLQDYWISRSFLLNKQAVRRFIAGARYLNNNVFEHPEILPDTYHQFQKYKVYLGSVAFSMQKYYKTNLIYGYGRTEDVPYGGLFRITAGREFNEFKTRTYIGSDISVAQSFSKIGYFYSYLALGGYLNGNETEQGVMAVKLNYFSNLLTVGEHRLRNFVNIDYSRGFGRYSDEFLGFIYENGFSGIRNDSTRGTQRLSVGLESVLFSPSDILGFRFAFYGFTDLGYLSNSNEVIRNGFILSAIGIGLRIRNDNLLFNTLQIRLAFYPNIPEYSRINNLIISGEQLLRPDNFDPGPPAIIPYR